MTINVKKGDVGTLNAVLNQCEGEIVATKRRRNERAERHECHPDLQPTRLQISGHKNGWTLVRPLLFR